MAIDCDDPNALMKDAACFNSCVPAGMQGPVELFLLATIAGGSMDPDVLAQQATAAGFTKIPPGYIDSIKALLLCNIVNSL